MTGCVCRGWEWEKGNGKIGKKNYKVSWFLELFSFVCLFVSWNRGSLLSSDNWSFYRLLLRESSTCNVCVQLSVTIRCPVRVYGAAFEQL